MLKKCSHAVTLAAILGASSGLLFGQATTTVSDTFVGPDGAPVQVRMKITPSSTFTSADGFVVPIFSSANIISNGAFSIKLVPNAGTVPAGSSYRVDYTLNGIPFHETWVVPQSQTSVKLGAVRTLIPPPLSTVSPLTSVGDMFTLGAGLALARVAANAASTLMFLSQSSSSIPTWVQPSFAHLAGTAGDTQLANAYSGVGTCGANQFATTLSRNAPPTCVRPDFSNLTGTATAVQVPNLSALNGSLTDAQLANPYSGAGACPANQFAATLSRNAGPTCAQPAFSSVAGTASASQVPSLSALNGVLNDAQLASPYSGIGSCAANQAVTGLSRNAGPTCTTLNSGYVDTSIAKTGVDLNSSSQVQSTHISGAASNTVPVFNGSGGLNNSSLSQDANGNLSSANSLYVRGLTPWADVHAYGSRGVMFAGGTPGTITTTGTIAAGSPNLSTAADLNWAVGDGIVVPGAGPAPSLSSPSYLGVAICTRVSTGSTPFYDNSASCSYSPAPQYRSVSYTWKVAVKDGAGGQAVPASITANGPPVIMEGLGRLDFVPVPGNGLTLYLGTLGFGVQYAYCSKNPAWVNYGQQASITLTASATNYVYLDASQNNCPITASTTGYPANNLYYAIARVITGTAAIGNIMDDRVEVCPSSLRRR